MTNKIVPIQEIVYLNVHQRGYLEGYTPQQVIARNVIKAIEELGEVARVVFDGKSPPLDEIADVIIPLLVIAAEIDDGDVLTTILAKSTADVGRGVRGE